MKLQTLRSELDAGHPITGAYDADDSIAADQINAVNRSRLIPITSAELLAWSGQASDSDRPRIIKISEGLQHVNESIAAICTIADSLINRDATELDLKLSDRVDMVDSLVTAGVLSVNDRATLYELATRAISRAEELGLSNVRAGTIAQARNLTSTDGNGI